MFNILAAVFEYTYLAGDKVRSNWGWVTPNEAGAFLVMLILLTWLQDRREGGAWLVSSLLSSLLIVMLSLTYSRSAVVTLASVSFLIKVL